MDSVNPLYTCVCVGVCGCACVKMKKIIDKVMSMRGSGGGGMREIKGRWVNRNDVSTVLT